MSLTDVQSWGMGYFYNLLPKYGSIQVLSHASDTDTGQMQNCCKNCQKRWRGENVGVAVQFVTVNGKRSYSVVSLLAF